MIRPLLGLLALLGVAMLSLAARPACADDLAPHVRARLLVGKVLPGRDATLGIALDPGPGWHLYWQNPGETGYAPRFDWSLPPGYGVGAIRHPAPQRLVASGSVVNIHAGPVVLLGRLSVRAGARTGDAVRIAGSADLLVCSEAMCVPDKVRLARTIMLGDGPTDTAELARATERLPVEWPGETRFAFDHGRIRLQAALPLPRPDETLAAFPLSAEAGSPGAARYVAGPPAEIDIAAGSVRPADRLDLVIAYGRAGGAPTRAFLVHAGRAPGAAASPVSSASSPWLVLGAIGGALVGGLLLNLMPCVFPILSLKAMTLVRAGADPREARSEASGYLVGAVGVMLVLGGLVLALRAGGAAAGWAFQLQDPRIVALLLVLVTGIATNLAGMFELPSLPVAAGGRRGFAGGLGTGALAAFIATPCTGPFMAGALGAALVLPPSLAMLVFAGLGAGLALPFVAIGFLEPARRLLPRPGQWMVTLRHLLSLPMFATALGLAWLLGQQAGVPGMTGGLAIALVAGLALWWAGKRQRAGRGAAPAMIAAALALCALPWLPGLSAAHAGAPTAVGDAQPYSPDRLAALRRAHRPVLLYATADWCLTCKVNEATSLRSRTVRDALAGAGAVMMEADWTRNDPQVTQLLVDNGRAGVPLYLWYPAKGAPRQLPQVLTPALISALVKPPRTASD